jgi:hypothetical protein
MSRSCCKESPRNFNDCDWLAAAPRDMRRDKTARRRPLWPARLMPTKRPGKVALALLILNELWGVVVAALVVEAWLAHR